MHDSCRRVWWFSCSQKEEPLVIYIGTFRVTIHFLPLSALSGPAAVCQRSQCFVPLTLSAQHAQQSGACAAALEEAGPGTEKVCV